ncbi:unannotated protein [freshwater metagenome]|uniref:Unannotated protein n=1 Tax=freshwater metagenome TaxID=449393 RepID=A0A6J7UHC0_9ZZZZ
MIGASFPLFAPVGTQSFAPTIMSGPVRSVAASTAAFRASKLENVRITTLYPATQSPFAAITLVKFGPRDSSAQTKISVLAACTGVKETPKLTASASETANALRDFLLRIFLLNSSNLPLRGVGQWFI